MSRASSVLLALIALPLAAAGAGPAPGLKPFAVRYAVSFMGISAGDIDLVLKSGADPDSYVYETVPHPSLLARLAVSAEARERSEFSVGPAGIIAKRYELDDGSSGHDDSISQRFDWSTGRATGTVKHRPLDLSVPPGTLDILAIRAALLLDFARSGAPRPEYQVLDQDEVKTYVYTRVGTESINTAIGTLETVVYDSDRKGSGGRGRTWRYWCAPGQAFVPVRLEQRDNGRTRISFTVRKLSFP
jgi:hypothetical protein